MTFLSNFKKGMLHVAALALIASVGMALPQLASANSAANATIKNTVIVNYEDANANAFSAEDIVLVTVNLVSAIATLSAPADQYSAVGATVTYVYTVTNNSNGLDDVTISTPAAPGTQTNLTGTVTSTSVTTLALGGTTLSGAQTIDITAAPFNITVPNDAYTAASDSSMNGIAAGNTVVIDGYTFTVNTVTDTLGNLEGTINLTATQNFGAAYTGTAGTQVGEQGTFNLLVNLTGSVVTDPLQAALLVATVTTSTPGGTSPTDDTTTYIENPNVTIVKRVRNVTTAGLTGATDPYTFATKVYA
ncbi:MAG: hypothetical protein Q9M20_02280, partial [Mariprofundaceae bacterium]|nr:hypothetical protein [Mariprofundaceae bacterium]